VFGPQKFHKTLGCGINVSTTTATPFGHKAAQLTLFNSFDGFTYKIEKISCFLGTMSHGGMGFNGNHNELQLKKR
jgi:hypothetical protein